MKRSNRDWIEKLNSDGAVRDEAVSDLRRVLWKRLQRAFRDREGVDESLLEDVVQESLLKTLDNLDQFKGNSQFTTWATSIAVRGAFTELRRRHWKDVSLEQTLEDSPQSGDPTAEDISSPQDEFDRKSLVEEMYRIINNDLTEKQRTALIAELKGMPLEEIGRRMGSNRNAIYKLTHDARRRLKQSLSSIGYSVEDLQNV